MDNKFFGRKPYLELLKKRIDGFLHGYRQNIAIVGDELVGKTSLIFSLLKKYHDNRVLVLYLQNRPETVDSFARRFIGVLLYNFLINSGIELKEDLDFLIGKSCRYIPKTVDKIKAILLSLDKRKRCNVFTELLSLCESLHSETQKSCVVIFDEFHNLESLGVGKLYAEWSKVLMAQKNTMYIIISSLRFKTRAVLAKNLSLLFGNFEVMEVEPFDIKTSYGYIATKTYDLGLDSGLKNFVVHFTGGHPFYLEVITDALLKYNSPDLVDILEGLLFESSGILNQKFSNYLKRFLDSPQNQQYMSILHLISCGHNKLKDIAHLMHKTLKEVNLRVAYLLESDAIDRQGDFLKINDRVFCFWLKFVYQEKLNSLTFDSKNQKEMFRRYIEDVVNEFLLNTSKPVITRIEELMQLFTDDVVQIDRKKIKLTHFREIKPLEFFSKGLKEGLIGRSGDSLWIMAVKQDFLTEDYVVEFSKECKRYRNKTQKKIIVSLNDTDANAKLRALEEKIWMWDLNNLNQLFDLFSRPRLIPEQKVSV